MSHECLTELVLEIEQKLVRRKKLERHSSYRKLDVSEGQEVRGDRFKAVWCDWSIEALYSVTGGCGET
jgi:hypothetical protein